MFNTLISETALTTQFADSFFRNISGDDFCGDLSFVATMRALLAERVGEGDEITLRFHSTGVSKDYISRKGAQQSFNDVIPNHWLDCENTIFIDSINCAGKESQDAVFDLIANQFTSNLTGWAAVEKVAAFFQKAFRVLCFINDKQKTVFIAVERMDLKRMHYLQCAMFAFLPWYFDPRNGLKPEERKLIETLLQTDADKYLECITEFASKYDFREASIRSMLAGFELKYEKSRLEGVRHVIEGIIIRINDYNTEIAKFLREKRDKEIELAGLEAKIAEGASSDSEIMGYFLANKKLVLEQVTDTNITFGVKDYVMYYDEEQVRSVLAKKGSYIDSTRRGSISVENMRMLMTAIFIDQELKLRVCAKYSFALDGNVKAIKNANFGTDYNGYMPNTHINQYGCMGDYLRTINDLLSRRDYIGAIEQCVASCKSLNFMDYTVMNTLMARLYDSTTKCIELPDGKVVTPAEAIKYLIENKESED